MICSLFILFSLDVRDYTVFSGIVAPLLKELDAFRMTLNTNPVFVMTQILFKEYFAKISYVVDKLVSEKVNFSSSNSCLIQHVAKNIMGVKQKWIEIGRPGGTLEDNWDLSQPNFAHKYLTMYLFRKKILHSSKKMLF